MIDETKTYASVEFDISGPSSEYIEAVSADVLQQFAGREITPQVIEQMKQALETGLKHLVPRFRVTPVEYED